MIRNRILRLEGIDRSGADCSLTVVKRPRFSKQAKTPAEPHAAALPSCRADRWPIIGPGRVRSVVNNSCHFDFDAGGGRRKGGDLYEGACRAKSTECLPMSAGNVGD